MTSMMKREGRAKHGLPIPLSSNRSVPSSCTRCQRTCRGNTKTTGSVTALNRIFYSIARITSITHLTTSYDQLKSQGRNSHTSTILSRSYDSCDFFFLSTLVQPFASKGIPLIFMEVTLSKSTNKDWVFVFPLYRNVRSRHWSNFDGKSRIEEKSWGRSVAKKV